MFVVMYGVFRETGQDGVLLQDVRFGGLTPTRDEADLVAAGCVRAEASSGSSLMVVPRVSPLRPGEGLLVAADRLARGLDRLAADMYKTEELLELDEERQEPELDTWRAKRRAQWRAREEARKRKLAARPAPVGPRPKLAEVAQEVKEALERGETQQSIADTHGVHLATLVRFLSLL